MDDNSRENVNLYQKHEKEIKRHILMDMLKTFSVDIMLGVVAWKLYVDTFDTDIPREDRREHILAKVNIELDKLIG